MEEKKGKKGFKRDNTFLRAICSLMKKKSLCLRNNDTIVTVHTLADTTRDNNTYIVVKRARDRTFAVFCNRVTIASRLSAVVHPISVRCWELDYMTGISVPFLIDALAPLEDIFTTNATRSLSIDQSSFRHSLNTGALSSPRNELSAIHYCTCT